MPRNVRRSEALRATLALAVMLLAACKGPPPTDSTVQRADELLKWAKDTDWHQALVRAWRDVLMASPDADWCEAFLEHWSQTQLRDDPATVLALIPERTAPTPSAPEPTR